MAKERNKREERRKRPTYQREEATRDEPGFILIVCEGKNTEKSYFEGFRLSHVYVKPVVSGENTIDVVKRAEILKAGKDYEQVWCVFDKDDFSEERFNEVIKMANRNRFKVAYSNQAFEYWIVLHLIDHQGESLHRNFYEEKINENLKSTGIVYNSDGRKLITEDLFDFLNSIDPNTNKIRPKLAKTRVELAIDRAKRNYDKFSHSDPANEESSTTVFKLVEELRKYL